MNTDASVLGEEAIHITFLEALYHCCYCFIIFLVPNVQHTIGHREVCTENKTHSMLDLMIIMIAEVLGGFAKDLSLIEELLNNNESPLYH